VLSLEVRPVLQNRCRVRTTPGQQHEGCRDHPWSLEKIAGRTRVRSPGRPNRIRRCRTDGYF